MGMPRLVTQKEGRGNGSKTSIVNMGDVARAIKRPPQYTTKWFGTELGAQSTYSNVTGTGERAVVNGHHDTLVFQQMLDKFIDTYVLCKNCHLPEIDLVVKKGWISAKCAACGWNGDLDNNHKVANFILTNPPNKSGLDIERADDSKGGKKDKAARKAERAAKQAEGANPDSEEGSDNEEKDKKDKKEKKDKKDKKEKKDKKAKEEGSDNEDGSDAEAKKAKKEKKDKKDKKDKKKKKKS